MTTSIFIFMAGDNNLDVSGRNDIHDEMMRAEISNDLNVIVQFDRRKAYPWETKTSSEFTSKRLKIEKGKIIELADLGETNTGDYNVLKGFLDWGFKNYSGDRNIVVIWGHGGEGKISDWKSSGAGSWIALDESSQDALNSFELKRALKNSKTPIDILAFDACLMSAFELVFQLKGIAKQIVASQEIEPSDGWPYDRVFAFLSRSAHLSSKEIAIHLTELYTLSYLNTDKHVTHSALNMLAVEKLAIEINNFASTLLDDSVSATQIENIVAISQHFKDEDYIDLYDFIHLCEKNLDSNIVTKSAKKLKLILQDFILSNNTNGESIKNAHGISIYFPIKKIKRSIFDEYRAMDFHKKHHSWMLLLEKTYAKKKELIR